MPSKSSTTSPPGVRGPVLDRLTPEESARVLRALLGRHGELAAEAERLAAEVVADVDAESVAEAVMRAVLGVGFDQMRQRAGKKRRGYVEPTEAAWELLGEAIEPVLRALERRIELGLKAAAIATAQGIVLGLYRCRGEHAERVLGWAVDFPVETATHAIETLHRDSTARHGCVWHLPDSLRNEAPAWADMFGRASRRTGGTSLLRQD